MNHIHPLEQVMLLAMRLPGHAGNVLRQTSCSEDAAESLGPNFRRGVRVADLQLGRTLCELLA